MIQPSGENLDRKLGSKYALAMAVSKRARQIREGAPLLIECKSRNPITIAMEEIAAGKITLTVPTQEQLDEAERQEGIQKPAIKEAAPDILPLPEQEAKLESQEAGIEEESLEEPEAVEQTAEEDKPEEEAETSSEELAAEEADQTEEEAVEASPETEEPAPEAEIEEQETEKVEADSD